MLHLGDTVRELGTGRQGKVHIILNRDLGWEVLFADGRKPTVQIFKQADELELIKCPHAPEHPRFVPKRRIIG